MNLLLGFIVLVASAFGEPNEDCPSPIYTINGDHYVREFVKNVKSVESLSYDSSTNSLFVQYSDVTTYNTFAGKINLDTNELETIGGIDGVTGVSVDEKTNDVYFAAKGNMYKYNKSTNKAELYVSRDPAKKLFVNLVYAKDVVYFAGYPTWTVSEIENGEVSEFKELGATKVRYVVIDDEDNIFFSNSTGLYRKNKGSEEVVYYKLSEGLTPIEGLAVSRVGEVYASGSSLAGIFYVGKDTDELVKVVPDPALAITFDGDNNMIYSSRNILYRLKPYNNIIIKLMFHIKYLLVCKVEKQEVSKTATRLTAKATI